MTVTNNHPKIHSNKNYFHNAHTFFTFFNINSCISPPTPGYRRPDTPLFFLGCPRKTENPLKNFVHFCKRIDGQGAPPFSRSAEDQKSVRSLPFGKERTLLRCLLSYLSVSILDISLWAMTRP